MHEIKRIKCGNGNCYIVTSGESAVLVDTCRKQFRERILRECGMLNIRLIVLTHGHLDHVQNAAWLSHRLNAPVAMSRADIALLSDNLAQMLHARTLPGKIVLAASVNALRYTKIQEFSPQVWLDEGDSLERYGIPAKVIGLPGHTDGSIALDVEQSDLIVGDALMNMFYPTVSMLYHDEAQMLRSAERISALGERTIFFGHGKPVANRKW
ncbi:MAG: MBL fold metallo-hydrolase [Treponema sp.]|nr:MBL fold metallo-hydrolase [Treponema sp.]